jgi:hypothetical protein
MARLDDLCLHEQLLLLALHDDKGTLQTANFEYAAGGAVLAELLLAGCIVLEQAKKKRLVKIADGVSPGDPILDEVLQRIRTSKRAEQPAACVRRIAGIKRLRHRIADRLRLRGILGKREGRVLLIFSRDLYPTVDPEPERELVARIRAAVLGNEAAPAPTVILVALANQIGLLHQVLTRPERKAARGRLKQLAALEAVDEGTRTAIASVKEVIEANQAVAAAAVAAG